MHNQIVIYGAGGHGLVVAEAAAADGCVIVGFVDDHKQTGETISGRWPVLAAESVDFTAVGVIVAIGDNDTRERVFRELDKRQAAHVNVIHPSAWVSPSAVLGLGVYVGPYAAVNAESRIGHGVIINTHAVVEHHGMVDDFAHVAPNVALGGNVRVGFNSLVGVGASVRPGVRIGAHCIVGSGAALVEDVEDGLKVMGVPAREG